MVSKQTPLQDVDTVSKLLEDAVLQGYLSDSEKFSLFSLSFHLVYAVFSLYIFIALSIGSSSGEYSSFFEIVPLN